MLLSRLIRSRVGRFLLVVTTIFALVLGMTLTVYADKGTPATPGARLSAATYTSISGNPLTILVATDGSAQVYYTGQSGGQFYDGGEALCDHGDFLWAGGVAYGPDFADANRSSAGNDPTPLTEVSQSGLTGDGSAGNPWVITTTLGAGQTGVQETQTVTYVNGQQYYRVDATLSNTSQTATTVTFFHAADLYLQGSDNGYGYYNASTGGVGGYNQAQNWYIVFQPITAATRYEEDGYGTIWDHISSGSTPGPGLDNSINPAYLDNGAGLQWSDIALAPSQVGGISAYRGVISAITVSFYVAFGVSPEQILPTPTPTGTVVPPTATPTVVAPTATPTVVATPTPTVGPPLTWVSGAVVIDADGDGVADPGEIGMGGVTLIISSNGWSATTRTGLGGFYDFAGLRRGKYNITITLPGGYTNTSPLTRTVEVDGYNPVLGVNFGINVPATSTPRPTAVPTPTAVVAALPAVLPKVGDPLPLVGILSSAITMLAAGTWLWRHKS